MALGRFRLCSDLVEGRVGNLKGFNRRVPSTSFGKSSEWSACIDRSCLGQRSTCVRDGSARERDGTDTRRSLQVAFRRWKSESGHGSQSREGARPQADAAGRVADLRCRRATGEVLAEFPESEQAKVERGLEDMRVMGNGVELTNIVKS